MAAVQVGAELKPSAHWVAVMSSTTWALDGAKTVAVSADMPDVDAMVAALSAPPPELLEIMQRHGVIPPLTTYVEG